MASLYIQVVKRPGRCPCGALGSYSFGYYARANWRGCSVPRVDYCGNCAQAVALDLKARARGGFSDIAARSGSSIPKAFFWEERTRIWTTDRKLPRVRHVFAKRVDSGLAIIYWPNEMKDSADVPVFRIVHTRSGARIGAFVDLSVCERVYFDLLATDIDWRLPGRILLKSARVNTLYREVIKPNQLKGKYG